MLQLLCCLTVSLFLLTAHLILAFLAADHAAGVLPGAATTLPYWQEDAEASVREQHNIDRLTGWRLALSPQAVQLFGSLDGRSFHDIVPYTVLSRHKLSEVPRHWTSMLHHLMSKKPGLLVCHISLPDLLTDFRKPLCSCCDMAASAASGIPCAACFVHT